MEQKERSLDLLADYLSGREVAQHSIGLQMPDGSLGNVAAKRFFALRAAFGVSGWADKADARASIDAALSKATP